MGYLDALQNSVRNSRSEGGCEWQNSAEDQLGCHMAEQPPWALRSGTALDIIPAIVGDARGLHQPRSNHQIETVAG